MVDLTLLRTDGAPLRVLCVGAHCDDIEIGCGATLHAMQARHPGPRFDWVVLSGGPERRSETQRSMDALLGPAARGRLVVGDFPDGRFPSRYLEIKEYFESLKDGEPCDVVLCHERDDRHQDHRIVNEMVWNTFRDHLILEYEVPKWDGGLGQPSVYVPVGRDSVDAKVQALLACYASQRNKDWFTADTFLSLMRLRGLECRSPSGYAEAFHGRKIRLRAH